VDVGRLLEELGPPFDRRIAAVREVARALGVAVWWVGGGARDRLLGRPTVDLDLVVEGGSAGAALAAGLAARLRGRVVEHPRFLTATVDLEDGATVDVATARAETYERPAALPTVTPAPLGADLWRRDFSINAIALRLVPEPPELCDPCGGVADLRRGLLRVLHANSFRDDPTRILRGVRFEARFGFALAGDTERLAREALADGVLEDLTPERLRAAWALLFESVERVAPVLARCAELGLLAALEPALASSVAPPALAEAAARKAGALDFAAVGLPPPRPAWLGLLLAAWTAPRTARQRLAGRFALSSGERERLVEGAERIERLHGRLARAPGPAPHEVEHALRDLGAEELALLAAASEPGREWVERDLAEMRRLRLAIRGADLVAAGLPPGPEIGRALAATRAARLDRHLGAEGELAFALAFARREREDSA